MSNVFICTDKPKTETEAETEKQTEKANQTNIIISMGVFERIYSYQLSQPAKFTLTLKHTHTNPSTNTHTHIHEYKINKYVVQIF